jgi:hypothetical protein
LRPKHDRVHSNLRDLAREGVPERLPRASFVACHGLFWPTFGEAGSMTYSGRSDHDHNGEPATARLARPYDLCDLGIDTREKGRSGRTDLLQTLASMANR